MNELSLFNDSISGAQSTDKEQSVKALSSSNNLNNGSVEVCDAELDLADFKYDFHTGNPAVYVSSYHRYNCGNLDGMWVDLTLCGDYDEFMQVCRQVVWDEQDPEFMFQDMENWPEAWYDEGSLSEDTFERIQEFAALDEDEQEAFESSEAQQPGKSYQAIPKRVPRVRTVNTEGQMVAPVLRTRGNPGHPALGRSSARRAWPRLAPVCRGPGRAALPPGHRLPSPSSSGAPVSLPWHPWAREPCSLRRGCGRGTRPAPARIHIGGDPRRGSPPGVFR